MFIYVSVAIVFHFLNITFYGHKITLALWSYNLWHYNFVRGRDWNYNKKNRFWNQNLSLNKNKNQILTGNSNIKKVPVPGSWCKVTQFHVKTFYRSKLFTENSSTRKIYKLKIISKSKRQIPFLPIEKYQSIIYFVAYFY